MATPTSGEISISDLQAVYSPVPRTTPGSLSDYYAGGGVVASGEKLGGGGTGATPVITTGELSLSDFYDLRATVHPITTSITATTSDTYFDAVEVAWSDESTGETADSYKIGYSTSPSGPYVYVSTDAASNPITSSPSHVIVPAAYSPAGNLLYFKVKGVNFAGDGNASETTGSAYKKAPATYMVFDAPSAPIGTTVADFAGQGISTLHVYAAVGAGGSSGPYYYLGATGGHDPSSTDGGYWWIPHYTFQRDLAGAGGGGAGGAGYRAVNIPVTPATPISVTVGSASNGNNGGQTTVTVNGTNYVVATGGNEGGTGGLVDSGAPGTPAGLPSTFIPTAPFTGAVRGAYNGPVTYLSYLQGGSIYYPGVAPPNGGSPSSFPAPTSVLGSLTHAQRAMYAVGYGVAGKGGTAGTVTTGTSLLSPTHPNSANGYSGVNIADNRPITSWPNGFGGMHGAGAKGYTFTIPNTDTVSDPSNPSVPVTITGPAYPGSGSLTVNVGYGGHWKAPNFPAPYGKVWGSSGPTPAATSFPTHTEFQDSPSALLDSNGLKGGGGFAWLRFNGPSSDISATPYSVYTDPSWPAQHSANNTAVPSTLQIKFSNWYGDPADKGPVSVPALTFTGYHQSTGLGPSEGGTIGGGPIGTNPTNETNYIRKVHYFPLTSSTGVTTDPGTLAQSQIFTNHAVTNDSGEFTGYSAGGHANGPTGGQNTDIAKFAFPSTSITSNVDDLATGRAMHAGFSLNNGNRAYVAGGFTGGVPSLSVSNTMEGFTFPSETNFAEPSTIGTARMEAASSASSYFAYIIAGASNYPANSPNTNYDHIDKFSYSSGITQTDHAEFTQSGRMIAWSAGGYTITSTPRAYGFAIAPHASEQTTVGYGESRDFWYGGLLWGPKSFPPQIRNTSAGTAVSGYTHGFMLNGTGPSTAIEKFPFASGYYGVDSVSELSPTPSTTAYGYGAPIVA